MFNITCLTCSTSHLHLCGLIFVHHFINVADLSNIIMEKNINPIHLFWSNYSSKTHSIFFSFSSFTVSHKFNITSSFMWLNFSTSLHKCWWAFIHHYREKDESNSSLLVKQLRQNPFHPFSSFLPSTCLASLTSHLHLYDLTSVHHFINVAELLYIIIEKKMNPILLFWSSYFSKTHFTLLTSQHLSNKLTYWAKQKVGLDMWMSAPNIKVHPLSF